MATTTQVNSFISKLGKLAQAEAVKRKDTGANWVLPSVCIAQAALETGWGTSALMTKANAYFGIKANSSWKGKVYSSKTKECYNGVSYTTITDLFRAYDSLADSVSDYYKLICNNSRYSKACNITDYEKAITEIKNGGYCTDSKYVSNITSLIKKYNLTDYDKSLSGTNLKSVAEIAQEVINGKWGSGSDRKNALTKAGYDYQTVQNKVNEILTTKTNASTKTKSVTEIAKEVIAGKWGNGSERKKKLELAGYDYSAVQKQVTKLLKK